MSLQFFWEKKNKKGGTRSRFNLLLLEYGEYYLEDFSAYQFGLGAGETINEGVQIQGRLKLSSRSLVFEPNEVRYPLLRFAFKNMQTDLVELKAERIGMSLQLTEVFTFSCTQYFEMKAHNKIDPFKIVELPRSSTPLDSNAPDANAFRFVFALVHSRLDDLKLKVEQFRHIVKISERMGSNVANQHLRPFIEHALISTFDSSNLVDFHEKYLLNNPLTTRKILPLISHPGSLMITESRLYFQPAQLNNIGDASQKFELRKVSRIYKRRYLLRRTGLEFFLEDGSSHLFVFESRDERDHVFDLVNTKSAYSRRPIVTLDKLTRKWQRREISNFQYLMHLNNEAGRTTNDLTQYPVFPHILADYSSKTLNIESSFSYRDLSKPIGALNRDRLEFFRERFESMPPADPSLGLPPPFLYGTHYSTPGYVLFYLVRVAPEYMLCLQNGRFDAPDRMFHSVADMWESCLNNPTDLKELIPEFFTGTGDFLSNADDLDLGHRSSGERLHDVVLPPWADSTRDFIRKHVKALESEYVSDHLHEWIDLIFGFKQQGEEAVNADNLFYYLTYENSVDLDTIKDPRERAAIENQIQEFGQTPSQLFAAPHPRRNDLSAPILTVAVSSSVAAVDSAAERASLSPSPSSSDGNVGYSAGTVPASATSSNNQKLQSHGSWSNFLRGSESSKSPSVMPATSQSFTETIAPTGIGSVSSLSSAFRSMLQPRPTTSVNRLINNSTSPVPVNRPGTPILSVGKFFSPVGGTGASTIPSVATVSGGYSGEPSMLPDEVPIIHFDDDICQSVESLDGYDDEKSESDDTGHRTYRLSRPLPLTPGKQEVIGVSDADELVNGNNDNGIVFDPTKLRLFPSELFYWHTKSITDIALRITCCDIPCTSEGSDSEDVDCGMHSQIYLPFSGCRKLNAILATVSKDSLLKIVRIEQDLDMSQICHHSAASMAAGTVSRTQCTISRSFSASGSSLSSCALTQDALKVVLGSWDNHIYGYNISSSTPAGKKFGHYDSVTCSALDEHDAMLATGSLDGTVKLWKYGTLPNNNHIPMNGASYVPSASGFLPGGALVEFEDHEYPVTKVAITCFDVSFCGKQAKRLIAGAAEDGKLIVWDADSKHITFTMQCSPTKRSVTALLWVHNLFATPATSTLLPKMLVVCTQDGKMLCIDAEGAVLASIQLDTAVLCLGSVQGDGRALLGGGLDGSVRLWSIVSDGTGKSIRELQRWNKAHSGPVSALAVAGVSGDVKKSPCEMMVTGSEDCSVKVWRIAFEK